VKILRKTMTILILIALASTLILMRPNQAKATQDPNSTVWVINPGNASRPTKWSAEAPLPEDIGGSNFTFHNNTSPVGSTFFVNITVSNVTALKTWGLGLEYDNTTLQYVSAWRPTDHVFSPIEDPDFPGGAVAMIAPGVVIADFDGTHQEVQWGCAYIMPDPPWTFNGTGVICQIQFRIIAPVNDTQWTVQFDLDPEWTGVYFHPSGNEAPPNLKSALVIYTIPEYTTIAMLALLAVASVVIVVAKNRNKRELAT
jgi:hypothetical protein